MLFLIFADKRHQRLQIIERKKGDGGFQVNNDMIVPFVVTFF